MSLKCELLGEINWPVPEQLAQLRQYYVEKGVKINPASPSDTFADLSELISNGSFIGQLSNEKDVELLLNALFSLIVTYEDQKALSVLKAFCQLIEKFPGSGWQSNVGSAVRVLSNLFHIHVGHPQLQLIEFTHLLKMCGRARLTTSLDTSLERIDELAATWGLNIDQKRELLRLLHVALLEDERQDSASEVMAALLRTYTDADADRAKEDARECVRTAIVDPKSFIFDHLLRLKAVKRLEETDPQIHKILKIFAEGQLEDYRQFVKQNAGFVAQHLKVDEAVLETKIKMLTLVSLAKDNQTLPLAMVGKKLDIADEELLEEFIIDAIRMKAISGKINEFKKELLVTSFQHRTFDRAQWELLQKRLAGLLESAKWAHSHVKQLNRQDELENGA